MSFISALLATSTATPSRASSSPATGCQDITPMEPTKEPGPATTRCAAQASM